MEYPILEELPHFFNLEYQGRKRNTAKISEIVENIICMRSKSL